MGHTNYPADIAAAIVRAAKKNRENIYQPSSLIEAIIDKLLPMHKQPVDILIKSTNNVTVFLKALNLDLLEPSEKIIKAFQVLHPKKSLAGPYLSDVEFQQIRRAIGNTNYDKAYSHLSSLLEQNQSHEVYKKRIFFAAAIIGTLGGAQKAYQRFLGKLNE